MAIDGRAQGGDRPFQYTVDPGKTLWGAVILYFDESSGVFRGAQLMRNLGAWVGAVAAWRQVPVHPFFEACKASGGAAIPVIGLFGAFSYIEDLRKSAKEKTWMESLAKLTDAVSTLALSVIFVAGGLLAVQSVALAYLAWVATYVGLVCSVAKIGVQWQKWTDVSQIKEEQVLDSEKLFDKAQSAAVLCAQAKMVKEALSVAAFAAGCFSGMALPVAGMAFAGTVLALGGEVYSKTAPRISRAAQ